MTFKFNEFTTNVFISQEIPRIDKIADDFKTSVNNVLFVCDENTVSIAEKILSGKKIPVCVLKSGEEYKNWQSVEKILRAATDAGLGRDSVFIGVGGGVIGDLCAFAASVYMRGCRLALVATTLLAMVDASVGGKTGFDLFDIKNLTGTFYPAQSVYMPLESLASLPQKEWKSGFAELIKTAVLEGDDFIERLSTFNINGRLTENTLILDCIKRAVQYKAGIVSEDLRESGRRMLLNLGHTFAHALESSAGLGKISHGEAVAWGIVRSCELGHALGITPRGRAEKITALISSFGYDYSADICGGVLQLTDDKNAFLNAMKNDKKKKAGKLTFIVPNDKSAQSVTVESENDIKTVEKIILGEYVL